LPRPVTGRSSMRPLSDVAHTVSRVCAVSRKSVETQGDPAEPSLFEFIVRKCISGAELAL
jgi:hypothetical protein